MSKLTALPCFKVETPNDILKAVKSNKVIEDNVNENLKKYPSNVIESIKELSCFVNSLKNIYSITKGTKTNSEILKVMGTYQSLINDYNMECVKFVNKCIEGIQNFDLGLSVSKEDTKQCTSMVTKSTTIANELAKQCSKCIEYSDHIHKMVDNVSNELTKQLKEKEEFDSNIIDMIDKKDCNDLKLKLLNSKSILESNKVLKSFWEKVLQQCKALSDDSNIKGLSSAPIEGDKGLINYENSIKLISYTWLSLAKVTQSLIEPLKQLKLNIDDLMTNLPMGDQSINNIKRLCDDLKDTTTTTTTNKITAKPSQ